MRAILNTIKADAPFMYERQGLGGIYQTGTPEADGSNLLPFTSRPFTPITGAVIKLYIKSLCGNVTKQVTDPDSIFKNDKLTIHYPRLRDSGVSVTEGYYYLFCTANIPGGNPNVILDQYEARLYVFKGTIAAEQCVIDELSRLAGGDTVVNLFKTEPFYMPNIASKPALKGSFNSSFNESFS